MVIIMPIAARETLPSFLSRKKVGRPMRAALPKQRSCRFVRLKATFDLTRVRSRGTEMYAAICFSLLNPGSFRLPAVNFR